MPKTRSGKIVTRKSTCGSKGKSLKKPKQTSHLDTTTSQKSLTEQLREVVEENVNLEYQKEELKSRITSLEKQLEDAKHTEIMLHEQLSQRNNDIGEIQNISNSSSITVPNLSLPDRMTPVTFIGTRSPIDDTDQDIGDRDNSSNNSNSSYEEILDEEENLFKIKEEDLSIIKMKADEEIARLIRERQSWLSRNPNHAGKFPKPAYGYRISWFVSEVMRNGFTDEYLSSRKLTAQDAKKGKNERIPMHPDEVHKVEKLCYNIWRKVPTIFTSKEESKKKIKGAIRRSMRTVLSNRRPNKNGSSL